MAIKLAPPRPTYRKSDLLFQQVAALSLWQRRLFLRRQRAGPDPYPRFRYKYKAIGTGTPEEREKRARELRDILVEGRLYLSSPRDFNDPFDMTARVTFEPKSTEDLRQRFKRAIAKLGRPWKERRAMLDRMMGEDRAALFARAKAIVSNHLDNAGVFSFAGSPRSILMWSHYGDHHTGICLQFEIARDVETLMQAVRMEYVTEYPAINYAEDLFDQIKRPLLRKFEAWRYEGESRIIRPGGARTYLPVKPEAVVGIFCGCRASDETIGVVRGLVEERTRKGHPPVTVYRAEKHDSRYKLVFRRHVL